VSEELKNSGYTEFGFFSFTPIGLAVLVVAIVYMVTIGRRLLPATTANVTETKQGRSLFQLWDEFRIDRTHRNFLVTEHSPLAGLTIRESRLESEYHIRLLGILRKNSGGEERIVSISADTQLLSGDALLTVGKPVDQERALSSLALGSYTPTERHQQRWLWELGATTILIHPESGLIGKSLRETGFRDRFGLHAVGLRRHGEPVADFEDRKLGAADTLLVTGSWSDIQHIQSMHRDFVVLETPTEQAEVVPQYRRMPVALTILAVMVLLSIFNVVPLVAAVLMAVLAAVFSGCLSMEDSYRSIHWSSLVLVAGMLPLADALEITGGTGLIVDTLMASVGDAGPNVMLTVIFFLTAALGLFLSNTASAVLVAPIAIYAAEALGVSPYPFAIAVLIAASAAFVTPVSTPVVTLVVDPGRYAFTDFIKVGVPLLLLTYAVVLLVVPLAFPFNT